MHWENFPVTPAIATVGAILFRVWKASERKIGRNLGSIETRYRVNRGMISSRISPSVSTRRDHFISLPTTSWMLINEDRLSALPGLIRENHHGKN